VRAVAKRKKTPGGKESSGAAGKKATKKAGAAKKTAAKKKTTKKTPAKKATKKATKKSTKKAASTKKSTRKTAAAKSTPAGGTKKATSKKSSRDRKPAKATAHLSRKEVEGFRQMLLEKRRSLLGDMTGMSSSNASRRDSSNLSSMPTHMADIGSDNFEHEFTLGLLASEKALLQEIDEALDRIEKGTYGICLGTGEPIPTARLQAKPWAKYTVDFTRKLEQGLVSEPEDNDDEEDEDEADEESE
jgi:RNA polymerase-binding protein DksA